MSIVFHNYNQLQFSMYHNHEMYIYTVHDYMKLVLHISNTYNNIIEIYFAIEVCQFSKIDESKCLVATVTH